MSGRIHSASSSFAALPSVAVSQQIQFERFASDLLVESMSLAVVGASGKLFGQRFNLFPKLDFFGQATRAFQHGIAQAQIGRRGKVSFQINGFARAGQIFEFASFHGFADFLFNQFSKHDWIVPSFAAVRKESGKP